MTSSSRSLLKFLRARFPSPVLVLALAIASAAWPMWSGTAAADISVAPPVAAAGATVDLTVTVNAPAGGAALTALRVEFPDGRGLPLADAPLHPGWTSTVDRARGGVQAVTWEGGPLAAGTSDAFVVTITLPTDVAQLAVPVLETYADGSTVHWSDPPSLPGSSPTSVAGPHPRPQIQVTGAVTTSTTAPATTSSSQGVDGATTTSVAADKKKDEAGSSSGVRLIFIGVGIGLLVAVRARTQRKRKARREQEQRDRERAVDPWRRRP